MRARKALKGTGIVLSEDLCKEMRDLLGDIKKNDMSQSVWAWNGKLFVKPKSGVENDVISVRYGDNWKEKLKSAIKKGSATPPNGAALEG